MFHRKKSLLFFLKANAMFLILASLFFVTLSISVPFLFFLGICYFTPSSLSLSSQPAVMTKFLLSSKGLQSSLSFNQTIVPFLCQTALKGKITKKMVEVLLLPLYDT